MGIASLLTPVLAVLSPAAFAQPLLPVVSSFDANLDGWTSNTPSEVTWRSVEGNPGGHARFTDGSSNGTQFFAPARYLGDWQGLDGTAALSYDHRIFQTGSFSAISPYRIAISGPGGSAVWSSPGPTGVTPWVTRCAPISPAAWTVNAGSWEGVLADVGQIMINIEMVTNTGGVEITGVDNVRLEFVAPCYADCEFAACPRVLDTFDFLCFQNRYDAGDPYACDCDTGSGPGVCDIFDFLCFQNAFAAGCP